MRLALHVRPRCLLGVFSLLTVMTAVSTPAQADPPPPRVIRWREGQAIPPGYRKTTEPRTDLIITGAAMFGSAWIPSAVVSFRVPELAIPVAGPIAVAVIGGRADGASPLFESMVILDAVQQAAGLAVFIAGIASRRTVLIRDDQKAAKPWVLPAPMAFGNGSAGLGLVGAM